MTSDLRQAIFAITLITWMHAGTTLAQSVSQATAIGPKLTASYASHSGCVTCHFPKPGEKGVADTSKDFVQTTPATVWLDEDKHRKAFTLLLEEDNRDLVRGMLGFELNQVVKHGELDTTSLQSAQLARLKQCLHCHAARPYEDGAPVLNLELGVSCQACHGPGSHWFQPHQDEDKVWRLVSPREKERLHMTDVRSPITRAKLCASCHVGDMKQERFVTHEMYANGHPPLPSFEPESFAAQMPPHWRKLPEKTMFDLWDGKPVGFDNKIASWLNRYSVINRAEIQSSYRQANYANHPNDHDPRQDLPLARGAIVGGAVVLQSYLNLLADMTDTASSEHRAWPEFAAFDCTACHHELRTGPLESGRPFRRSPPGRPPMPLWPTALVRVGIGHLARDSADATSKLASFDQRLRHIEAALTRQPFGDARQVHATAKEMATLLETLAGQLEWSRFDIPAARRALLFLTDPQQYEIRDYHSARQLAWAIRQIGKELATRGTDIEADRLFVGLNGRDRLGLNLPAGQQKSVVRNLASSLDAIANYDPNWFAAELKRIRKLLAAE